jgi:Lrp/AsnC family transcriptional regulator, leucine-responsive regulatory protein
MAKSQKKLDDVDRRIVYALAQNSRISLADLAKVVSLSPQSVAERMRRLEDAGIISAYGVTLDPSAVGLPIGAYIRVSPAMGELPRVAQLLASIPEIVECDRVTGEDCFIARVQVAEIRDLEKVIDRILPHARTNTSIIQSSPVPRRLPKLG